MSRVATDADFNAKSRELSVKLEIYFDGETETPLTVMKNDYLVDASWLEEGSADSSNPYGEVSSFELTFRLYNTNGIFSPTNVAGPYYGKIKTGVPVKIFIKPESNTEDIDWLQLGLYYVTGWDALITGTYADVTADDKWHDIFSTPLPVFHVSTGYTYKSFLDAIFTAMGFTVNISDTLLRDLPYAFVGTDTSKFLQDIISANIGYAICDKNGVPYIGVYSDATIVRAALTDDDQIKSISSKQSVVKTYNGVELTYSLPQISSLLKLADLTSLSVAAGAVAFANVALDSGPLWQLLGVSIKSPQQTISLGSISSDLWQVSFTLNNSSTASTADVTVYGKILDLTDIVITDNTSRLLRVSTQYIQTADYAAEYNAALTAYISSNMPTLSLSIRGNPLLSIGDRVSIQSVRYAVSFSGIIQRLEYAYNGALSCTMTLLNTAVL